VADALTKVEDEIASKIQKKKGSKGRNSIQTPKRESTKTSVVKDDEKVKLEKVAETSKKIKK